MHAPHRQGIEEGHDRHIKGQFEHLEHAVRFVQIPSEFPVGRVECVQVIP